MPAAEKRSPKATLWAAVKAHLKQAINIKKLDDADEIAEWSLKQLIRADYFPQGNVNDHIVRIAWIKDVMKARGIGKPSPEAEADGTRQLSLFNDLDVAYPVVDTEAGYTRMVMLGDFSSKEIALISEQKDVNIEAALAERVRWRKAVSVIKPLLDANPGWRWRDAVEYLRGRGALPEDL